MLSALPDELIQAVEHSPQGVLVTVDRRGAPLLSPVHGELDPHAGCLELAAPPAQARAAAREPRVGVLVGGEPTGVLVQGTARVLEAGRLRVRPERIYAWPEGDDVEPRLFDAHVEEVRSAHNTEPETGHAAPAGTEPAWDARLDELGGATAALAFVGPDGFPFAVRVPVRAEREAGVVHVDADPIGAPIEPGLAGLSAAGLELYGDLLEDHGRWVVRPHRVV